MHCARRRGNRREENKALIFKQEGEQDKIKQYILCGRRICKQRGEQGRPGSSPEGAICREDIGTDCNIGPHWLSHRGSKTAPLA